MTTPTARPVPSNSPVDLLFNAEKLDEVVNATSPTYVDRFGVSRLTVQGATDTIKAINDRGDWSGPGTDYESKDIVKVSGTWYIAVQSHTSSAAFATDADNWRVYQGILSGELSASTGATLVGTQQPFASTRKITQAEKNQQLVHIGDFSISMPGLPLQRAIAETPAGGTLKLGAGPYIGNFSAIRNNLTIIGEGKPTAKSDRSALESGTVIRGNFRLVGNDLSLQGLGVDCGTNACADLNSGNPMDGFVVQANADLGLAQIFNIRARDIVALCKAPDSMVHAVLLEGVNNVAFENIHGYQGFAGVVIKASDGYARGIFGYKNSQAGVYIKSDNYAPCLRMLLDDIQAWDEGLGTGVGVHYWASSFNMSGILTGKIRTRGFGTGVKISSTPDGQTINDLSIAQIFCNEPINYGLETNSNLLQSNIASVKVAGSVSGKSVRVGTDNLGLKIGLIEASSPTGLNLDDAIFLGGAVDVDDIVSTQQYAKNVNPGTTVDYNSSSPKKWRIGSYVSRLSVNTVTLANGWTAVSGDAPTIAYRNGRVDLAGRVAVPATPWTSKERIMTVNLSVVPKSDRRLVTAAMNGSTGVTFNVQITIGANGQLYVNELNDASKVPAATTWVMLSGISWDVEI